MSKVDKVRAKILAIAVLQGDRLKESDRQKLHSLATKFIKQIAK